jgi:hypothetical protein
MEQDPMRVNLVWTLSCVAIIAACGGTGSPDDVGTDVPAADRAVSDTGAASDTPAPTDVQPDIVQPSGADATRADVSVPTDVGPDVVASGDGGACSLPRTYALLIMGMTVGYFRFTTSGTWQGALSLATLDTMPSVTGTYAFTGARITIFETGTSACPTGAMGAYDVAFDAACGMRWTLVSDPCTGRSATLDGATFTAVP